MGMVRHDWGVQARSAAGGAATMRGTATGEARRTPPAACVSEVGTREQRRSESDADGRDKGSEDGVVKAVTNGDCPGGAMVSRGETAAARG